MMVIVIVVERRAFRTVLGICHFIMTIAAGLLVCLRRAEIEMRSRRTNSQAQKQGDEEERVHETNHRC